MSSKVMSDVNSSALVHSKVGDHFPEMINNLFDQLKNAKNHIEILYYMNKIMENLFLLETVKTWLQN